MKRTAEEAAGTRRSLIEAGLAVFSERGFARATLDEIARRARVTRGALYHHFADKADLYVAAIGEGWEEVLGPLMATLVGEEAPIRRIERFVSSCLIALEAQPRMRLILEIMVLRTELEPELRAGLEAKGQALDAWVSALLPVLEEAKRRHELRAGLSPHSVAVSLAAFIVGVATTFLMSPQLLSPAQEAQELVSVLVSGIRAETSPKEKRHARSRQSR